MCLFLYLFFCLLSGENLNTAVELVLLFVSDMSIFFFGKGEFKKKFPAMFWDVISFCGILYGSCRYTWPNHFNCVFSCSALIAVLVVHAIEGCAQTSKLMTLAMDWFPNIAITYLLSSYLLDLRLCIHLVSVVTCLFLVTSMCRSGVVMRNLIHGY